MPPSLAHPTRPTRGRSLGRLAAWFVAAAAADVVLTAVVLRFGGFEANPAAAALHRHLGMPGLAALKAAVVVGVLAAARVVATRRRSAARRLLLAGVLLNAAPVVWSAAVITRRTAHAWHCDVCGWQNGF